MLKPSHFQEWRSSAVDPSIISLNVESLSGDEAIERLTENAIEAIGKDQKVPHSFQYATSPVAKILNRYSDMSSEGWWASGIDILTGEPSRWGCFKPDRPRVSQDKGKPIKYEHPAKCPTEIFALRVSYGIGLKIAKKQGLKGEYVERILKANESGEKATQRIKSAGFGDAASSVTARGRDRSLGVPSGYVLPWGHGEKSRVGILDEIAFLSIGTETLEKEDREFWQWVLDNPSIALLITEGAKKAGSLLTAGYVAIALPGIYSGYRQEKDPWGNVIGLPRLIPQLLPFCGGGREVVFCFDQDTKPKTIKNVQIAIQKTGKLLEDQGCKVSVARWDKSYKGVDDLIASQGEDELDRVFKERISLEKFNLEIIKAYSLDKWHKFHRFTAKEKINQQYLGIDPPKKGEILIVNSPTNTGKSTLLKKWSKDDFSDMGIIRIGNRNSLELQFCNESDFYHLQSEKDLSDTLLTDPKKRVSFCFPSLIHTNSSHWENTVIYGDEIDGTIQQALFLNKDPDNLDRFKEALELCDRAVFLSGTIYDHHIAYLKELCPSKTFRIVQNDYQTERPKITLLEGTFNEDNPEKINSRDKSPLLDRILADTDPIMVQSDSKHFLNCLAKMLGEQENTDTLLITSDTLITDKKAKAFIEDPNGFISNYSDSNPTRRLVVLASPTMTSGNDINIKYFKRDYHFYCGQLSAVLISQKIIRIRDTDCQRFLSIPEYITSDDTEKCEYITQWQNSLINAQINLLDDVPENKAKLIELIAKSCDSPHYKEAIIYKWIREFERKNYRESVTKLLTQQGYEITKESEVKVKSENTTKLKEVSNEIKDETSEAIYKASDKYIGKDERSIEPENQDDLMASEKAKIIGQLPSIHYSESWSSELIRLIKFDNPRLVNQLTRRYLFNHPETLKAITAKRYHRHADRLTNGKTSDIWRDKSNLAVWQAINAIKIGIPSNDDLDETSEINFRQWIDWGIDRKIQITKDSPAVSQIVEACKKKAVSNALGRKPGKDPIKFLSWLVSLFGYELAGKQVKIDGEHERRYTIREACQFPKFLQDIQEAIARKYAKIETDCTSLNWDFFDEKITQKNQGIEIDSTPYISIVPAVTDHPNPLIEVIETSVTALVLPLDAKKEPLIPNYWGYTPGERVSAYHEGYRWLGLTVEYGYEENGRCMLALRYPDGEICGFSIGAVTVDQEAIA